MLGYGQISWPKMLLWQYALAKLFSEKQSNIRPKHSQNVYGCNHTLECMNIKMVILRHSVGSRAAANVNFLWLCSRGSNSVLSDAVSAAASILLLAELKRGWGEGRKGKEGGVVAFHFSTDEFAAPVPSLNQCGKNVQCSCLGWPTGNGKKLSCSQACCLAQLCLVAA